MNLPSIIISFFNRGRSCTTHKAKRTWVDPPLYDTDLKLTEVNKTSPLPMMIYAMQNKAVFVTNADFKFDIQGKLHYRNSKNFNPYLLVL